MSTIPPSLWLYGACVLFALVARISVEGLETGNGALDRLPFVSLVLVSCLASAAALYLAGPETQQVGPQMVVAFLVGQLAMAGWIDRQTTWVPDTVLIAVLSASSAYVFTHSVEPVGMLLRLESIRIQTVINALNQWPGALLVVLSVAVGVVIWLLAVLLWGLQTLFGKGLLTPPDIVALGLPIYLLGISLETGFVYLVAVFLALTMQKSDLLRSVFSNPDAVKEGREHLGLESDGPAVAVLSLMFSILAVVVILREPLQAALERLFGCTAPSLAGSLICP